MDCFSFHFYLLSRWINYHYSINRYNILTHDQKENQCFLFLVYFGMHHIRNQNWYKKTLYHLALLQRIKKLTLPSKGAYKESEGEMERTVQGNVVIVRLVRVIFHQYSPRTKWAFIIMMVATPTFCSSHFE